MLEDSARWRAQLEKEGFPPQPRHVAYRLTELAATFALGTFLMTAGYPILASIVYGAFFGARCGWSSTRAGTTPPPGTSGSTRIQAAACGFGLSTSGDMWNQMHNKHHATPQKVRHDMDLDTTPAVAFFKTAEDNRPRGFSPPRAGVDLCPSHLRVARRRFGSTSSTRARCCARRTGRRGRGWCCRTSSAPP